MIAIRGGVSRVNPITVSSVLSSLPRLQRQPAAGVAAYAAKMSAQAPQRPKVAVGQMTAVGDQLKNYQTCSRLAEVSTVGEAAH